MPITTDQTRLSIDFAWEHTFPAGDRVAYQIKFYHSEVGGILQIANGVYEPFEVPVEMFTEVAEFLIAQGVIKGSPLRVSGTKSPIGGGTAGMPSLPGRKPLAPAIKAEPVQALVNEKPEDAVEVDEEQAEMLKQRMTAKAKAAINGAKNKFRKEPIPDPNPPKKRPGSVRLGEMTDES